MKAEVSSPPAQLALAREVVVRRLSDLDRDHEQRLMWFHERNGQVVTWPGEDDQGRLLVTRAKGIYKPSDLSYALSVRIMLKSPYADGDVVSHGDGAWSVRYHQEGGDPRDRDGDYANVALMANARDGIPVGVLHEVEPSGKPRRYRVLGLADVRGWDSGYFLLAGGPRASQADWSALHVPPASGGRAQIASEDPGAEYDERQVETRAAVARLGQPDFRLAMLTQYRRRCAISGCLVEAVLEAAHLRPYRGQRSNVPVNGLLLRSDLHTLLDAGLMGIHPLQRTVHFAPHVAVNPPYRDYDGQPIARPLDARAAPAQAILAEKWASLVWA